MAIPGRSPTLAAVTWVSGPVHTGRERSPSILAVLALWALPALDRPLPSGQDLGAGFGDGDGVLEVRCEGTIRRPHGPPVGHHACAVAAEREHRLDRDH